MVLQDADDLYVIHYAWSKNAHVVSNDHFRDWMTRWGDGAYPLPHNQPHSLRRCVHVHGLCQVEGAVARNAAMAQVEEGLLYLFPGARSETSSSSHWTLRPSYYPSC